MWHFDKCRLRRACAAHGRIQRGVGGPDPSLKNHKNIGFHCNTGPDPLKITKLPSEHSMLGHHRVDDGPFIAVFGSSIPSSTKKLDPL